LEKLLFFFKFYSKGDNRTLYKANIEISPEQQLSIASQSQTTDHSTRMISGFVCHLNFWSMLPSISFNEAFSNCHSIILASGTLCPFDTFCGELKTTFKYQMEGQQIIESERIFASSISKVSIENSLNMANLGAK
jgi:Rad3-related DNA helicase